MVVQCKELLFHSLLCTCPSHSEEAKAQLLKENPNFDRQHRGGYSTLSWVRMCGPKFRPPAYNKTREDANLQPISKPFVS